MLFLVVSTPPPDRASDVAVGVLPRATTATRRLCAGAHRAPPSPQGEGITRHFFRSAYPTAMSGNHDDHDHHHHDHSELSETELRVRALETILTEKGYVDPAAVDPLIETAEHQVVPRDGARGVA